MRKVFFASLVLTLLIGSVSTPGAVVRDKRRTSPRAPIIVRPQSNICVSVHVDQRVLPRPLGPDSARNFSGHLMSEVRRIYIERGGSRFLPGTNNVDRFQTDEDGTNPLCRQTQTDVHILVQYGPRSNGAPFVVEYQIMAKRQARANRIGVDVAGEIHAGRLGDYSQHRTNETIIFEDMWRRAPMIAAQLRERDH